MLTVEQLQQLRGRRLVDAEGRPLGEVDELYADRTDDAPTFATVRTADRTTFVPLADAVLADGDVAVPYDGELLATAPSLTEDDELSAEEEERLYSHYGLPAAGTAAPAQAAPARAETVDGSSDGITLAEEILDVRTEQVEAGRARLRKYVTTQTETRQVPVRRESVVVEREPLREGDVEAGALTLGEEQHEIRLHEEVPVVTKETVPVERVRLAKESVVDEVTVTEDVRREHLDESGIPTELRADGDDRR